MKELFVSRGKVVVVVATKYLMCFFWESYPQLLHPSVYIVSNIQFQQSAKSSSILHPKYWRVFFLSKLLKKKRENMEN